MIEWIPVSWGQEPPYWAHVIYITDKVRIMIERQAHFRSGGPPTWHDWICPKVKVDWKPSD